VREVHGEVVGLLTDSTDYHPRFAEVTLGLAWHMRQRYEHLSGMATTLPDVVFDYRVLARETVLVPQALIDALGRMTLLLRSSSVLLKDLVDYPLIWVQLRSLG